MSVQIGITEVQQMGYIKLNNGIKNTDIPEKIKEFYTQVCHFKVQPYSELKYWEIIKSCDIECYGINNLIRYTCPMIDYQNVTEADKRRFRNIWQGIIKNYSEVCGYTQAESEILSDVGLKLPLVLACLDKNQLAESVVYNSESKGIQLKGEDLADIAWFYNCLFNWYVSVNSESYVEITFGTNLVGIINVLVSLNNNEFIERLASDELQVLL